MNSSKVMNNFFFVQIGVFLDLFIFIIIFFHVYDSMMSLSVYSLAACADCEQSNIKTKHAFTGMVFFFRTVINTELFMVDALFLFYSTRDGCIVLLNVNVKFAL